jgi:cytochrome c peroxidase
LAKAIASFERTAVSQPAPFDAYIKGDKKAMTAEQKEGWKLFTGKANCVSCHDGFNFTDGSFHNMGLHDGELNGKELGRYLVKRRGAWYGVFKTPTLRDIAKSAPYFHDGSIKSLEEATMVCNTGRFETAKNLSTQIQNAKLSSADIRKIAKFMEALSGPDVPVNIPTKFPQ